LDVDLVVAFVCHTPLKNLRIQEMALSSKKVVHHCPNWMHHCTNLLFITKTFNSTVIIQARVKERLLFSTNATIVTQNC